MLSVNPPEHTRLRRLVSKAFTARKVELCVCNVQDRVPIAGNLLSYHLRILREAGLVTRIRRGRWVDYRLDGDGFTNLWAAAAAAGVPLPGEPVAVVRAGGLCEAPA